MKIIIAIPCLNRGGTEMQTLNLVRVLIDAGHMVTTLCYFEFNQEMVSEYQQAGCKVELMKLQRSIRPWTLIHLLRKRFIALQPDVVHVQYMAPGALPIIAARLAGINKILATVHQPYTPSHGKLAKILLRFSANLCTRFIAVSVNAEISWFGSGRLFNENISLKKQARHFTIYNAVDVEQIQSIQKNTNINEERNNLGIPERNILIGTVSRLRHEKGIDLLLEAFALTTIENRYVHLLIVGSGPDEDQLKERATELKLNHKITFYGEANWETAMQQMALMDVVVVPSRFEGFGLTAAEAMAMGKPVVASDVFGLSEVVSDQETGLLFKNEDTQALANCLIRLCSDSEMGITMGINGKIKAEKMFAISVFEKRTIRIYNEILK